MVITLLNSLKSREHPIQAWAERGEKLYCYSKKSRKAKDMEISTSGSTSHLVPKTPKNQVTIHWPKACKKLRTEIQKINKQMEGHASSLRSVKSMCTVKGALLLRNEAEKVEEGMKAVMDAWSLRMVNVANTEPGHAILKSLKEEMEKHEAESKLLLCKLHDNIREFDPSSVDTQMDVGE